MIFELWGCQDFKTDKTLENSQGVGSNIDENLFIGYDGPVNNEADLKAVDLISDLQGSVESEYKTATYEGRIDERFIEITFQNSSNESLQEALILSDDLINDFSSLDLSPGDPINIEYCLNENNQKVIFKIENFK